ncbi:MAG: NADH-quinone oxidoreductase subunit NuoE [Gammaproteobacteria bacterium]
MTDVNLLTQEDKQVIDHWVAKFPQDRKQSALLAALTQVQNTNGGWLSRDLLDAVANYLDLPKINVYEVATFYSLYELEPVGSHKIEVCTNISCMLCGSDEVVQRLQERLGIKLGETTPNGKITLREVECIAACTAAPAIIVDGIYHENLTAQKVDSILENLN